MQSHSPSAEELQNIRTNIENHQYLLAGINKLELNILLPYPRERYLIDALKKSPSTTRIILNFLLDIFIDKVLFNKIKESYRYYLDHKRIVSFWEGLPGSEKNKAPGIIFDYKIKGFIINNGRDIREEILIENINNSLLFLAYIIEDFDLKINHMKIEEKALRIEISPNLCVVVDQKKTKKALRITPRLKKYKK